MAANLSQETVTFAKKTNLMKEFDLEGHDFIALNQLMKLLNWVESGGEANLRIDNGEVIVNQMVELQRRKKLRKGDKIEFNDQIIMITTGLAE